MSGRLSRPWVIVVVAMLACAFGAVILVGLGLALLRSSSDIPESGAFRAKQIAGLPDGGFAVAGTEGPCGDLVLVRVAPDGKRRRARVEAKKLGGDCVDGITSVTVWRGGTDVLAELKEKTGGVLESEVLEERGLARFKLDGKLAESFGDKGVLEGVSGSVATSPDGGIADASGKRYFSSGAVLTDAGQPLDTAPGDELIAAGPDDRLLLAGPPRPAEDRDELLVARFNERNALDRTFGAEGVVALPLGPAQTLAPLADGSTLVGNLDGIFVRLNPGGRPDSSYGDRGVARAFDGRTFAKPAVGVDGELALLASDSERFTIRRLSPRGRLDGRFAPPPLLAPSGAAIAFGRAGRLLVLRDGAGASVRPTVIALDPMGRRVSPLGRGPLSVALV